jgi:hypothetical protein
MEINRSYSHKVLGAIGNVTLVVPDGEWTLDGQVLPTQSVAHLANFALQTLQDAYAGKESITDAIRAFTDKYDRLVEGTLGTRSGGGVDETTAVQRMIARGVLKTKLGGKSPEWAEFTGMDDDAQAARLDGIWAKNAAKLQGAFNAEMEARRIKRAAKVTGDIEI